MKISHIGILFGLIGLGGTMPTFASSICGAASGNLILNCGFETGDLTDWTVTPAATDSDLEVTTNIPNSGTYDARFGASDGENDLLDQSFTTTAGDSYTVSFYVDSGAGVSANGQFIANWNGGNILTITGANGSGTGPDTQGYEFYSFTETASSGSSDLEFGGNTKASYYHLDDVVVTLNPTASAVPEPSSISFAVAGLFGILLMGRRYMEKRAQQ